ncbi:MULTISPECIES: hypothetical protein [Streptomyces]|uniref:ApeI dehydratase-like domain-containing protein n=1 Tax=Streptomyces lycii TaxID=2654337 RepID=A0ABQ7FEG4_9ACTN|nr:MULTISPECIES: hypothetical protein [Streptomyces]KAF4406769.1 hypothetical protein GCU69_23265 [Streptomyces lycii]
MMLEQALAIAEVPAGPDRTDGAPEDSEETVVRGTVTVDAGDPFLAGHYPGFPLVPGFSLVQYVHDLVTGAAAVPPENPAVVRKARFLSPVRPGEEIVIEARVGRDAKGVHTTATVSANARPAAEIRLDHPQENL